MRTITIAQDIRENELKICSFCKGPMSFITYNIGNDSERFHKMCDENTDEGKIVSTLLGYKCNNCLTVTKIHEEEYINNKNQGNKKT